jgi:hypothetical protein
MKVKTTVILFGVFVILLVFVYLFEGPLSEKRQKKTPDVALLFPDFDKKSATKIEVKSPAKSIVLDNKGDAWLISETDDFTADPQLVNNALDAIDGLLRDTIVSKNPEKQDIFEVTPTKGVEVKVSDADQKMLAHFYIGKTASDFFSTYLRKEGSDEVLQVGSITSTFDKDIKAWRDKTVLSFSPDTVTQLLLKTGTGEIFLEKDEEGKWKITKPINAPAKNDALTNILRTLSSLKALDFAKDYDITAYQLDVPQITVTVILKDQEEKRLLIGKLDEEKSQYYAKNQAKKTIFLIGKFQFDTLNKTVEELKEEEKKEEPVPAEGENKVSPPPEDDPQTDKTYEEQKASQQDEQS